MVSGKELDTKVISCCALEQFGFALLVQDLNGFQDNFFRHALKFCRAQAACFYAFWVCSCIEMHSAVLGSSVVYYL